jgi:hypothetical protein
MAGMDGERWQGACTVALGTWGQKYHEYSNRNAVTRYRGLLCRLLVLETIHKKNYKVQELPKKLVSLARELIDLLMN